jgi:CHAT domain-containing protein/tetratricopeptide (TPR) repeat protein
VISWLPGLVFALTLAVGGVDEARQAFRAGDVDRAVEGFEQALAEAHDAGPRLWFDLGAARFEQRDLHGARRAFRRAVTLFDSLGRSVDTALAREGLARVQIEQRDWMGAAASLDAAEAELASLPDVHPHRARHTALRALVEQGLGRLAEAERSHEEALDVYRSLYGNQHPRVASMLQNLGALYRDSRDSLVTTLVLEQALDIVVRTRGADDPRRVRALLTFADWKLSTGYVESARSAYEDADAIVVASFGPDHADRIEPLRGVARCRAIEGDLETAIVSLERAAAIYDAVWARGGRDLLRATAFSSPWGELAGLYLRHGDERRAWSAWEAHVGRLAEERLGGDEIAPDELARRLPPRSALMGWLVTPASAHRVHRFSFVVDREGLRWHDLGVGSRDSLEVRLRKALADPHDAVPVRDLGRRVHARWFEPADLEGIDHLYLVPTDDLLGVPVAALPTVGGGWFGDRRTTTIVPSATVLARSLARPARTRPVDALLAVADPDFGGDESVDTTLDPDLVLREDQRVVLRGVAAGNGDVRPHLPPLHATREEVTALQAWFDRSSVLTGADADEPNLRRAVGDGRGFDVVHLATHALIDPVAPERSALVLTGHGGGSGRDDGLLVLREILDEWDLDAELVTLSACETGLGRATTTEGLLGFPFAFLRVGARSVVVSQWKVADRATAHFMRSFYEAWLGPSGMSRAEALRHARIATRTWRNPAGRRPWGDPAFWAAFVLVEGGGGS